MNESLADIASILASSPYSELETTALAMSDMLTERVGEESSKSFRECVGLMMLSTPGHALNNLLRILGNWRRCEYCTVPFEKTPCHRCCSRRYVPIDWGRCLGFDVSILPQHDPMTSSGELAWFPGSNFCVGAVVKVRPWSAGVEEILTIPLGCSGHEISYNRSKRCYGYGFKGDRALTRAEFVIDVERNVVQMFSIYLLSPDGGLLGRKEEPFGRYSSGTWRVSYAISDIPEACVFPAVSLKR